MFLIQKTFLKTEKKMSEIKIDEASVNKRLRTLLRHEIIATLFKDLVHLNSDINISILNGVVKVSHKSKNEESFEDFEDMDELTFYLEELIYKNH